MTDRFDAIKSRYRIDEDETLAVLAVMSIYDQIHDRVKIKIARDSDDDHSLDDIATHMALRWDWTSPWDAPAPLTKETVVAALGCLADPAVAEAVLSEARVESGYPALALGVLTGWADGIAPPLARPALFWLRANAHQLLGDIAKTEADLQAAESLDPLWPLTLEALARYASDRSEAENGLALLRRAQAPPDDQLVMLLEKFRPPPRPNLGRNEPCWCGSGRKYKVCHLHREQLPLDERADWLYQKAVMALQDSDRYTAQVIEAAHARVGFQTSPRALAIALEHVLIFDVVLFEGGAFANFLTLRGYLLPGDERLLAEQWLLMKRSVHEVISVRRGEGMTLRDVRTGDLNEVRERAASNVMKVGNLYCARVVPAGDTVQIFGGIEPVTMGQRDELIALLDDEPDPIDLVETLSRRST